MLMPIVHVECREISWSTQWRVAGNLWFSKHETNKIKKVIVKLQMMSNMHDFVTNQYQPDWQLTRPFVTKGLCKHLLACDVCGRNCFSIFIIKTHISWHLLSIHGILSVQFLRYTITKTTRHMSPLHTSKCSNMYSLVSHYYHRSADDYIDDSISIEFFWWNEKEKCEC